MIAGPVGSLGVSERWGAVPWRFVRQVLRGTLRAQQHTRPTQPRQWRPPAAPADFEGTTRVEYRPDPDGDADPGEVVWTWVPFEEDHSQGKDRPVLVIGRNDGWLLGLMLTSKDHDRDAGQQARAGRVWMDIGTGGWDPQHRPSEVRLDRVLRLDPARVRREGAALDRARFDAVAARLHQLHGW